MTQSPSSQKLFSSNTFTLFAKMKIKTLSPFLVEILIEKFMPSLVLFLPSTSCPSSHHQVPRRIICLLFIQGDRSKEEDRGNMPGRNLIRFGPGGGSRGFSTHQEEVINEINVFKRNSASNHIPLQ